MTGFPSGLGFGMLGGGFINQFQREMNIRAEQSAREAQGRIQSAAERGLHIQQQSAGAVEARETVRSEVLLFGQGLGIASQPNMFNRWMDIRESEDELQEFLSKCVAFGKRYQTSTTMTVKDLDK